MDDIDFSDIEDKYYVEFDDTLDNVLIVDGIPIIDDAKKDKLYAKISKAFQKQGVVLKADKIFMPWNESSGKSKGYMFIEFDTAADATHAINAMDRHPFDAKHTFLIDRFTDFEKFLQMKESYVEPEDEEYVPKEHLRSWLTDAQGRDQYVTYRGDSVEILWHGKRSQCEIAHKPEWREFLYVAWSPLGTFMATLHRPGVRLWGGPSWKPQQRFAHPLIKLIDFSPNENYIVTWSNEPIIVPDDAPKGPQFLSAEDEGNNLAIWDIKTGHVLRTFSIPPEDGTGKKQMAWPLLKWSPDDKFVGRVISTTRPITPTVPNGPTTIAIGQMISIYELPNMGLHDKKSIKIEGVADFEWCPIGDKDRDDAASTTKKPRDNMLVYWTPEVANQPARVTLLSFPSRTILRQKNLFNVSECKLFWQNQGDFLCVKVDRHTKTKKSVFCNLEIFRVREKDYPVEVVELKDAVTDFSWEPNGERFALVSSNDPNLGSPGPGITIKTDVSFYQLDRGKNDFKLLRTLPSRTSNAIRWSPRGRNVVLATVGSSSKSELDFWDLDFNNTGMDDRKEPSKEEWGNNVQLLGTADHYGVTDVEWDPSGRYLATSASAWQHTLENGYAIWDFRGQELDKQIQDRFKQFIWRPRPRTLLNKDQQRQIRKNLKEYSKTFEEEDARNESQGNAEQLAHRKRLVDEWNAWRTRCQNDLGTEDERVSESDSDEEREEIELMVEEVIEQIEEEVVD